MTTIAPQPLGNLIIETQPDGSKIALLKKGYPESRKPYAIDGEAVRSVFTFPYHDFVLLRTDQADYLRDLNNQPLPEEGRWSDHFFEPITKGVYRQDARGNWYDLEGFRLSVPIFLKGDVLISLPGKVSKQSLAFTGQELMVSPNSQLIQVGKLVYNRELQTLHFFGERVTGLGAGHVSFGGTDQWQEVHRGLTERGWVNEFTGQPLLVNDEEITHHRGSERRGSRRFEVFASASRSYVLENHSAGELRCEGIPLEVDWSTYVELDEALIVLVSDGQRKFYFNLNEGAPFRIPEIGEEALLEISAEPVHLAGTDLYSVRTAHRSLVYDAANRSAFALPGITELPTAVRKIEGFEADWFMAEVDEHWRLCDVNTQRLIKLGEDGLEIAEVLGKREDKLVEARTASGSSVCLDVRGGAKTVRLATVGGQPVEATIGPPHRVGSMLLQHVRLASLGGSVVRLVDLERPQLQAFTLPTTLTQYPDQPQLSAFAGNEIVGIDFQNLEKIQGETFYRATFLTYTGEERKVLLQTVNAQPLLLDGVGHRNELVVAFNPATREQGYRLGAHVMVSVATLTEDLKPGELLYSLRRKQSWLPFYDSFLPVFRRAIPLKGKGYLPILLFESLEHVGSGEYVAVERNEPYRLLAERKKKGKVVPKIVTTKSRALLDPAEVSGLIDLFVDRGMLVEVG